MELRITPSELLTAMATSHTDGGVLVIDVPDAACVPRLSIVACRVFYRDKFVKLRPGFAAIVSCVLDRPKTFGDVLDESFLKISDASLRVYISQINALFLDAGIPFHLSCRNSHIELVED